MNRKIPITFLEKPPAGLPSRRYLHLMLSAAETGGEELLGVKYLMLAVLFGLTVGIVGTLSIATSFSATVFETQGSLYATYQGKTYRLMETDFPQRPNVGGKKGGQWG